MSPATPAVDALIERLQTAAAAADIFSIKTANVLRKEAQKLEIARKQDWRLEAEILAATLQECWDRAGQEGFEAGVYACVASWVMDAQKQLTLAVATAKTDALIAMLREQQRHASSPDAEAAYTWGAALLTRLRHVVVGDKAILARFILEVRAWAQVIHDQGDYDRSGIYTAIASWARV